MTNAEVIAQLKDHLGEQVISVEERTPGRIYAEVKPGAMAPGAGWLFTERGARFVITVGVDKRPLNGHFKALHIFSFDKDQLFLTLCAELDAEHPEIDSITPRVPAANWAERELHDVIGVEVKGHPDPRRLLLADDWPEGVFPLRRDFPYDCRPEPDPSARPSLKEPPEGATVLPVGPFYPVLEEPAYFRLFVQSETVVGCDYRGFYNHRGIEKLGDSALTINQVPFLAERICGICGFIHSTCYCEATEQALGLRAPRRARYIRSVMLEIERIQSHLLWLGIAGHIIGFETVLMQSWRIREPIMWLCEEITGNRKTYGMNIVGGVRRDITAEQQPKIRAVLDQIERESLAVVDAIQGDTPLMMRLGGVGLLSEEAARRLCVVGPTARGSGLPIDARVDHPYAAYDELVPDVKVQPGGDILARTLVRLEELMDSIRLVREGLDGLLSMPEGDLVMPVEGEVAPGREGICVVEAPRGEAIHYVLTGENNRHHRWRVRAPTYPNIQAVPAIIQGLSIADVPISIGSLDPCFSCTERVEVVDVDRQQLRVYTKEELLALSRKR